MTTLPEIPPSPAVLRKLLERLAVPPSEFMALVIDHFGQLKRHFAERDAPQAWISTLLELVQPAELWAVLRTHYAGLLIATQEIWSTNAGATINTPERVRLQQMLQEYERDSQACLRWLGSVPDTLQREIRRLRSELKRGASLYSGQVLGGRFELVKLLGRGAMAEVWLATDRTQSNPDQKTRSVALKVLHQHHQLASPVGERFRRGAQLMAQLNHAHIVKVLAEPRESEGRLYFPMTYLAGGTLQDRVLREALSPATILKYFLEIAHALHYAHETIVHIDGEKTQCNAHRDLSPFNVLFDADGNIYLTDFDMTLYDNHYSSDGHRPVGRKEYSAPECQETDNVLVADRRADVFSLALVMLFAFTRVNLRLYDRTAQILQLISSLPYNDQVKSVFTKALETDREKRFTSLEDFSAALAPAFAAPPVPGAAASPPSGSASVPPASPGPVTAKATGPMNPAVPLVPPALQTSLPSEPAIVVVDDDAYQPITARLRPAARPSRWGALLPCVALLSSVAYGRKHPTADAQALAWVRGNLEQAGVPTLPGLTRGGGRQAPGADPVAKPEPIPPSLPSTAPIEGDDDLLTPSTPPNQDDEFSPSLPDDPVRAAPVAMQSVIAASFAPPSTWGQLGANPDAGPRQTRLLPGESLPLGLARLATEERAAVGPMAAAAPTAESVAPPRPIPDGLLRRSVTPKRPVAARVFPAARGSIASVRTTTPATRADGPAVPVAGASQVLISEIEKNNRYIIRKAESIPLCQCLCMPKDAGNGWAIRNPTIRAAFDFSDTQSLLTYSIDANSANEPQIQRACVMSEIRRTIPELPFPHSSGRFELQTYCGGAILPMKNCETHQ